MDWMQGIVCEFGVLDGIAGYRTLAVIEGAWQQSVTLKAMDQSGITSIERCDL